LGLKPAAVSAAPAFFFGWNATDTLGAPACELTAWYCVYFVAASFLLRLAAQATATARSWPRLVSTAVFHQLFFSNIQRYGQ
jgi:hypothetical protein